MPPGKCEYARGSYSARVCVGCISKMEGGLLPVTSSCSAQPPSLSKSFQRPFYTGILQLKERKKWHWSAPPAYSGSEYKEEELECVPSDMAAVKINIFKTVMGSAPIALVTVKQPFFFSILKGSFTCCSVPQFWEYMTAVTISS